MYSSSNFIVNLFVRYPYSQTVIFNTFFFLIIYSYAMILLQILFSR
jgi:hypothetical protein